MITHVWTVIIAFTEDGFWAGILSLFLPFLAELYWMFNMFGINDTYAYIALVHLLLAIPFSMFGKE
jgi:ABC-type glycerol-3-phosphate transport system permease component